MRMKDEPEVEEEEEEEEEEKEKEGEEEKKPEAGSSGPQQERGPGEAVQEVSPPTELTCSKETKQHGNVFLYLCSTFSLIVDSFEKSKASSYLCIF